MTPTNLALVGLRLLAVYTLIEAIQSFTLYGPLSLASLAANLDGSVRTHAEPMLASLIPGGLTLLLAILLYGFSKPLARRMAPPIATEQKETVFSYEELQAVLFSVTGLLILAIALPNIGRSLERLITLYSLPEVGRNSLAYFYWFYFVGVLAQVALGLVLLLNPRGLKNTLRWLRTAGT